MVFQWVLEKSAISLIIECLEAHKLFQCASNYREIVKHLTDLRSYTNYPTACDLNKEVDMGVTEWQRAMSKKKINAV